MDLSSYKNERKIYFAIGGGIKLFRNINVPYSTIRVMNEEVFKKALIGANKRIREKFYKMEKI